MYSIISGKIKTTILPAEMDKVLMDTENYQKKMKTTLNKGSSTYPTTFLEKND